MYLDSNSLVLTNLRKKKNRKTPTFKQTNGSIIRQLKRLQGRHNLDQPLEVADHLFSTHGGDTL